LTERLRKEVAEACPGMTLRFIPACATGLYQVQDTDLNKPVKGAVKAACLKWRMSQIQRLQELQDKAVVKAVEAARAAGAAGEDLAAAEAAAKLKEAAAFDGRRSALTGMKILRNKAPGWLWQGLELVMKRGDDGTNMIQRGWRRLYISPATADGYVAQARARRDVLLAEAAAAEALRLARDAVAASSAEGPAPTGVVDLPAAQAAALNSLVASVGELEAGQHDADVPQVKARATKGGPARASRAGARGARQLAAEDDVDGLLAAGGPSRDGNRKYDSMVDSLSNPEIFVVTDGASICPAYLIQYE